MTTQASDATLDGVGTFTTFDRCDRCQAQAAHRSTKVGAMSELLFCNHHFRQNQSALRENYWLTESDRTYVESSQVAPSAAG